MVFAVSSFAGELPELSKGHGSVDYGYSADFNKSTRDTIDLIGPWPLNIEDPPTAQQNGQFQDREGSIAWNDWTSLDATQPTVTHWNVSTYNAANLNNNGEGNRAAWCGSLEYASCGGTDPEGGYGNSWYEALEWAGTVDNVAESCTVHITAYINYNNEDDFDYSYLTYITADGKVNQNTWNGTLNNTNVFVDETILYEAFEYVGPQGDEVRLQFRFESDGAWSDEDCLFPTDGAMQVDDVTVTLTNGTDQDTFDDFESEDPDDFGNWYTVFPDGNGDYAKLWTGLQDIDPCYDNYSPSVAFIDDGVVVPGTGGTQCVSWCYGPGGYTLNNTGGLSGTLLDNSILSKVLTWPGEEYVGCFWWFDVYRHEGLFGADDTGMLYEWWIRSTDSEDPADIETATWIHSPFIYYGGPDYIRASENQTSNLVPSPKFVQVRCGVMEYGAPFDGNDGTPAPYFDNARLIAYPFQGPAMSRLDIHAAQDDFPDRPLDFVALGNNDVRFDMALNISANSHERNDPGDSLTIQCAAVRANSELVGHPRMVYKVFPNPLFDPYRDLSEYGLEGFVEGDSVRNASGGAVEDTWYFDLPDENFLYPGDQVHYYFEADDSVDGDLQTTRMTGQAGGSIEGFDDPDFLAWDANYQMRALPTITEDPNNPGEYLIPKVLFWNDFGDRGGRDQWHNAFRNLGFVPGIGYDTYMTQGPSSGVGNGLGGRATAAQLQYYTELCYTVGDLDVFTMGYQAYDQDASDDIAQLTLWLSGGDKDMFLTGDGLIQDLANADPATLEFMEAFVSVRFDNRDIRPLIDGQTAPVVLKTAETVFQNISSWIAYGGCRIINQFDATTPINTATRQAEFADANGTSGAYGYSAATLNLAANNNRTVHLPYDLMYVMNDPADIAGGLSARVRVLEDVLSYFGVEGDDNEISDVPVAQKFTVSNYPNPFNPSTKIAFTMPQRGHLTLKIYNVRGELVRTLIDEVREAGADHIMWDGSSNQGSQVSSGVYFYEARTGGEVKVEKMALVK